MIIDRESRLSLGEVQDIAHRELKPIQSDMEEMRNSQELFTHQANQMVQLINDSLIRMKQEQVGAIGDIKRTHALYSRQTEEIRTQVQDTRRNVGQVHGAQKCLDRQVEYLHGSQQRINQNAEQSNETNT